MLAWVRRRDRHNLFKACPYQRAPSPPMTPELYEACDRAVHVITTDGRVFRAGRASLFVLERIGWGWAAKLLTFPPFIWFVEFGYRLVADHRTFFSRFIFTHEPDPHDHPTGSACGN